MPCCCPRHTLYLHTDCTRLSTNVLLPPLSWPACCRADQRRVPSHGAATSLLRALRAACQLVEQLAPAVHRASLHLLAQLAHSFFMPLCLTSLACVARIQVSPLPGLLSCGGQAAQPSCLPVLLKVAP